MALSSPFTPSNKRPDRRRPQTRAKIPAPAGRWLMGPGSGRLLVPMPRGDRHMCGKWPLAIGAGMAGVIAGCGGGAAVVVTGPAHSRPAAVHRSAPPAPVYSDRYCQHLDDGRWVTNDSASSTTACVPDPSDATGVERVDESVAIPRCRHCTMSEWTRAERQARSTGQEAGTATLPDRTSLVRSQLASRCTGHSGATARQCDCVADELASAMPVDGAENPPADDARTQAALQRCLAQTN
jgi:hypothetical protein